MDDKGCFKRDRIHSKSVDISESPGRTAGLFSPSEKNIEEQVVDEKVLILCKVLTTLVGM